MRLTPDIICRTQLSQYHKRRVGLVLPLWRGPIDAAWDGCLGRFEAGARMGAVTQWLPHRPTTPAKRKGTPVRDLIFVSVPVDQPDLFTSTK
jgi:hypothetical protein